MPDSLPELPMLASDRLVLRLLGSEFAVPVAEYFARNRAFAQLWNPLTPETFYTTDWQRERLVYDLDEYQAGRMLRFWLFQRADTQFTRVIGHVGLNNIVRGALHGCFVGYMIDEAAINQGLMTEAMRAVIGYAFGPFGLHRLEANIMPRNAQSLRVAEKLGFVREGLSPKYLRINGVWEDHYRYSLINPHEV